MTVELNDTAYDMELMTKMNLWPKFLPSFFSHGHYTVGWQKQKEESNRKYDGINKLSTINPI